MFHRIVSGGALAALLLVPATTHAAEAPTAQVAQASGVSAEWDALVKAAQKEGRVEVILAGRVAALLRKAFPAFEKEYGIKVSSFTGGISEQTQRVLAERRAGRYSFDVRIGGANAPLVELMPNNVLDRVDTVLTHPDVLDRSKWFQNTHHYSDPQAQYIFTWGASPSHVVTYNTKMVDPSEIKSYWDLLDPKWQGKIVAWSPATPGTVGTSAPMFLNPKIGQKWFERFANEMKPVLIRDTRQGAEWIALGRYPIGLFGMNTPAYQLEAEGFPIKGYLPHALAEGEMISASGGTLTVFDRPANPNAMKLFTNWFLTRDAQQLLVQAAETNDSLRIDIDNTVIAEPHRIQRDRNYMVVFTNPDYAAKQKEISDTLRRIMQDAGYQ